MRRRFASATPEFGIPRRARQRAANSGRFLPLFPIPPRAFPFPPASQFRRGRNAAMYCALPPRPPGQTDTRPKTMNSVSGCFASHAFMGCSVLRAARRCSAFRPARGDRLPDIQTFARLRVEVSVDVGLCCGCHFRILCEFGGYFCVFRAKLFNSGSVRFQYPSPDGAGAAG